MFAVDGTKVIELHTELLAALEEFLVERNLIDHLSVRLRKAILDSSAHLTVAKAARQTSSILRNWAMLLPIRHQGVLIAAVRGCDNCPRENSAKPIVRALRYAFLVPADERELDYPSAFMQKTFTKVEAKGFLSYWDHYPIHFILHLMHAVQVVGYKHPDLEVRHEFISLYRAMVEKLHVVPESDFQMDQRLTEDRILQFTRRTGER